MSNRYEAELARRSAIQASAEAARQERKDREWRERVLSPEEVSEYARLEAAAEQPTGRLEFRAAWLMYPLLLLWAAAVFGVLWLIWPIGSGMSPSTMADRVAGITVLFVVMFGGAWAVVRFGTRRAAAAKKVYRDDCAKGIRDFLVQIDYPERLRKAQKEANEESRDWDGRISLHRWP